MNTERRNEVLEASERCSAAGGRELEESPPLLILEFGDHLRVNANMSQMEGNMDEQRVRVRDSS